ncbi:MAG: transglycosylase SLT domain-containing protein [Planctomycetes bacterium]|nr:transglycosylase SLT domain-containing protein [Planctomycetota bacterium]MCB9903940.1 transglycosylase SLT domain-containing protein [Planctomycetota bacterium]
MRSSRLWIGAALLCVAAAGCREDGSVAAAPADRDVAVRDRTKADAEVELLPWAETPMVMRVSEPFTGDLDAIRERGVLRVLVTYSRTNFFLAEGRLRGFEYEMFHELEKQLASEARPGVPPLQVAYIPVAFDELLPALLRGHGDVAAASLTVTPERGELVRFTRPYLSNVDQVLVSHAGLDPVQSWDALAGEAIHVEPATSFFVQLQRLNEQFLAAGLEPLEIVPAARGLQTEDLLELVHSGAFAYTVADRYVAELWSTVLDGIRIEPGVVVGRGTDLAWAVRPDSPQLLALLDEFAERNKRGSLIGNVLFQRYYGRSKWIENPLLELERSKLGPFLEPMQRYAAEFGFDWRLIAAQAYQESRLDPTTVSRSGAVGLMQLLPSTAADMGVTELRDPERNLYAGVKYMDWLRRTYFDEPGLADEVRLDFCLAAYNAGGARVKRWRAAAPGRGLDPDVWFGNVELLALEDVGIEPVRYVGNINKYFVLFALSLDSLEQNRRARQETQEAATR